MAQFSDRARIVIENFAENLGCPARPAPDQSYGFVFSRSGTLSLAPSQDAKRITVSLARTPNRSDTAIQLKLFGVAGLQAGNTLVHAGIASDNSLVLAIDLDEDRFDMQSLDGTVSRLIELHNALS